MVLARSCALTAVSLFVATGLEHKPNTVRQQLREWCDEAKAKRGKLRRELAVEPLINEYNGRRSVELGVKSRFFLNRSSC